MKKTALKLKISKTLQGKIRKGYPWVFKYQVQNKNIPGRAGDLGIIYDSDNRFLAAGLYDPYSDICLRILQIKTPCDIDEEFVLFGFTFIELYGPSGIHDCLKPGSTKPIHG